MSDPIAGTKLGDYTYLEVVRINAQPDRVRHPLARREGFIVGCSDSMPDGARDYGVHVNEYGEVFAIPDRLLSRTGRIADAKEVVTRSGLHRSPARSA